MYAGETRCFQNLAGLQSLYESNARRKQEEREAAQKLRQLFGDLTHAPKNKKTVKTLEIQFRRTGGPVIPSTTIELSQLNIKAEKAAQPGTRRPAADAADALDALDATADVPGEAPNDALLGAPAEELKPKEAEEGTRGQLASADVVLKPPPDAPNVPDATGASVEPKSLLPPGVPAVPARLDVVSDFDGIQVLSDDSESSDSESPDSDEASEAEINDEDDQLLRALAASLQESDERARLPFSSINGINGINGESQDPLAAALEASRLSFEQESQELQERQERQERQEHSATQTKRSLPETEVAAHDSFLKRARFCQTLCAMGFELPPDVLSNVYRDSEGELTLAVAMLTSDAV